MAIARGKTHISRALERYLRWLGVKTRVYSLGDYRRKVLGGAENIPADYFKLTKSELTDQYQCLDAKLTNAAERTDETNTLRRKIKMDVEEEIWDYFTVQGGQVVIYDANNGNVKSRKETRDKFEARGVHVIFLGKLKAGPGFLKRKADHRRIPVRQRGYYHCQYSLSQAFVSRCK